MLVRLNRDKRPIRAIAEILSAAFFALEVG